MSTDTIKAFRLFMAPVQLLAAYQDRLESFCNRVRDRVPESEQVEAAPEIARPVMEAFAYTSDGSAMMLMFEELMAKAIDKREAKMLSPEFPGLIKSLSPLHALLISTLHEAEQYTDDLMDPSKNQIVQRIGSNFSFSDFGGANHHLTLVQDLEHKNLVTLLKNQQIPNNVYRTVQIPEGMEIRRTRMRLTMQGRWFVNAVTPKPPKPD